jgi:diguanylate cyclase (GGDEF)-like protein/PAS domain S-box-containing protein
VFVTAPGGAIRIANEAARRLTGYADDELIGMSLINLLDQPEKLGDDPLSIAREAGETVLRTCTGQTIPVSFVGSTVATEDPQFVGEIYVARDVTERKRAERRIRYLARYDALTKIPNRMQFQHLLQQAIARSRRGGHGVAMLYVDMDRFKEVNDTFGHASGDRVLEVLTERLTRVLNSEAVLGRLAGDEFALFVDGISQEADEASGQVAQLARTVLQAAGEAFHIRQQEVFLTVSIGVALCPRDVLFEAERRQYLRLLFAGDERRGGRAAHAQEQATPRGRTRRVRRALSTQGGSTRRPRGRCRGAAALAPAGPW